MKFSEFWKGVKELAQFNGVELQEIVDIDSIKSKCKNYWNRGYTVEETFDIVFEDIWLVSLTSKLLGNLIELF